MTIQNLPELIVASMNRAIYVCDLEWNIIYVNPAFEKLTGWSKQEVALKKCQDFTDEDVRQVIESNSVIERETRLRTNWGDWLDVKISVTSLLDGDEVAGAIISIENIKGYDEMNRTLPNSEKAFSVNGMPLQEQPEAERNPQHLIEVDKLISLGNLVSGIAHEIKNPITFISLNTPLLDNIIKDILPILDEYQKFYGDFMIGGMPYDVVCQRIPILIKGIKDGAERIKSIIGILSHYGQKNLSEMDQDLDINQIVNSSVEITKNEIKQATNCFKISTETDLPVVKGNFQRIEQVIINLIVNACSALENKEKGVSIVTSIDKEQKNVVIRIKDEGSGMSEANLKQSKDPFFTTWRNTGGIGLGLSISERIIQDHAGRLIFESKLGQGTTAVICLPVASSASGKKAGAAGKRQFFRSN